MSAFSTSRDIETPDPKSYFFGQKQLSADIRDLYGYLIDGMQGTRGAIRSGGDMEPKPLDGIPPTQEPLARFSGVVKSARTASPISSSTSRRSTAPRGSWPSPGRRIASAARPPT